MEAENKEKPGQPTKYRPEYCQEILDYFGILPTYITKKTTITKSGGEITEDVERANSLPTIEGFANKLGVTTATIVNWTKDNEEFLSAYTRAKAMQKDILIQNGMKGLYNPQFAQFVATNCTDMRIKSEVAHTGAEGKPLTVIVHRGSDLARIPDNPPEQIPDAEEVPEENE
jgi:hypothetical protein